MFKCLIRMKTIEFSKLCTVNANRHIQIMKIRCAQFYFLKIRFQICSMYSPVRLENLTSFYKHIYTFSLNFVYKLKCFFSCISSQ